jgi:hypothetical protein
VLVHEVPLQVYSDSSSAVPKILPVKLPQDATERFYFFPYIYPL